MSLSTIEADVKKDVAVVEADVKADVAKVEADVKADEAKTYSFKFVAITAVVAFALGFLSHYL